mmetsp:Transcript_53/g.184  ORF Transcript_53/g.184 Transcript_53/m.184 type:complete len:202 (+) Transcript_53:991-1596(+)
MKPVPQRRVWLRSPHRATQKHHSTRAARSGPLLGDEQRPTDGHRLRTIKRSRRRSSAASSTARNCRARIQGRTCCPSSRCGRMQLPLSFLQCLALPTPKFTGFTGFTGVLVQGQRQKQSPFATPTTLPTRRFTSWDQSFRRLTHTRTHAQAHPRRPTPPHSDRCLLAQISLSLSFASSFSLSPRPFSTRSFSVSCACHDRA